MPSAAATENRGEPAVDIMMAKDKRNPDRVVQARSSEQPDSVSTPATGSQNSELFTGVGLMNFGPWFQF